ncbi:MAG: TIGR00341 family protein [Candidatus Helarchaeota archaeon]
MRKIEIIIPIEKVPEAKETLNKLFYDYHIIEGEQEALLIIFTDVSGSRTTLDDLKRMGISTAYGRINILPILGLIPHPITKPEKKPKIQILSFEELMQIIEPTTHPDLLYITFCILSAIIAALGLIYNNVAVIVGSMVIAPLLGPIIGTSLTLVSDRKILTRSLLTELIGIIIAVLIGLVLGFLSSNVLDPSKLTWNGQLSEMYIRTKATYADFGLGIASGIAAGLCFITGIATALVGVAVAASLMPPAANVGLLLAIGEPNLALGSLIILLINLVCINFTCTITFFIAGIRSPVLSKRMEKLTARSVRRRLIIVSAMILILFAIILAATIFG